MVTTARGARGGERIGWRTARIVADRARLFQFQLPVQIAFLNSITMPVALMTPVITAAMSKLIKVVGSLSLTFMPSPFQRSFLWKRVETSRQLPVSRKEERRGKKGKGRGRSKVFGHWIPSDFLLRDFAFHRDQDLWSRRVEWRKLRSWGFLKVKFLPRVDFSTWIEIIEYFWEKLDKGRIVRLRKKLFN